MRRSVGVLLPALLVLAVLVTADSNPAQAAPTKPRVQSKQTVKPKARARRPQAPATTRRRVAFVRPTTVHLRATGGLRPSEAAAPVRHGPSVRAQGALVLDENGREIYARDADRERPIASISKLAAALVVADRGIDLDGQSTITRGDTQVARGGAKSRLLEGMTLTNRDLLHAALLGSDNRAIPALGRAVKLSPGELAAAMTAKAKQLGLSHTRFHDPTGLSLANVSTPRETIALLKAVIRHPVLGPITRHVEYDAHPLRRPLIHYVNTYRPAMRDNLQVLGGKTGYNNSARYCLVIAVKMDGQTYYMSLLGNEGKLTRFADVARVSDWIVASRPRREPQTAPIAAAQPAPR